MTSSIQTSNDQLTVTFINEPMATRLSDMSDLFYGLELFYRLGFPEFVSVQPDAIIHSPEQYLKRLSAEITKHNSVKVPGGGLRKAYYALHDYRISVMHISKQSPLEIVLTACIPVLLVALVACGGKVRLNVLKGEFECSLGSISETLSAISRMSKDKRPQRTLKGKGAKKELGEPNA